MSRVIKSDTHCKKELAFQDSICDLALMSAGNVGYVITTLHVRLLICFTTFLMVSPIVRETSEDQVSSKVAMVDWLWVVYYYCCDTRSNYHPSTYHKPQPHKLTSTQTARPSTPYQSVTLNNPCHTLTNPFSSSSLQILSQRR